MKFTFFKRACLVLIFTYCGLANASLITIDFKFEASLNGQGFPLGTNLSGFGAYTYDDSLVTPIGQSVITNYTWLHLNLGAFAQIGATSFNTSNVGVETIYNNGILSGVEIGGLIDNIGFVRESNDDFFIFIDPDYESALIQYSAASMSRTIRATQSTGAIYVPEPAMLTIFMLGIVSLVRLRRYP